NDGVQHPASSRRTARKAGLPRPGQLALGRRRGDRMTAKMKRRAFITLLGGAAAAWQLAARAQSARTSPGPEECGYIEIENLGGGQSERLPGLSSFYDPLRFHLHI